MELDVRVDIPDLIENGTRDYRGLLQSGARAQLEKLLRYYYKDGWEKPIADLWQDFLNEVCELAVEIQMSEGNPSDIDIYQRIRHEAADSSNYLHMIIQACDKRIEELLDRLEKGE